MKKQLLLLSIVLFSNNTHAEISEKLNPIAIYTVKGLGWNTLGLLIISSSAVFRLTKTILKIDEKIKQKGKIELTSIKDFTKLISDANQASHSKLQKLILFALTIPTAYCFAQGWNNYSSIVDLIKG